MKSLTENMRDSMNMLSEEDKELVVRGYGRLNKSTIQKRVREQLTSLLESANRDDFERVYHDLNTGVLQAFVKALHDEEEYDDEF